MTSYTGTDCSTPKTSNYFIQFLKKKSIHFNVYTVKPENEKCGSVMIKCYLIYIVLEFFLFYRGG